MRDLLRLTCLVAALALPAAAQTPTADTATAQTPFAPVAVVNGDPITGFDIDQRARLLRVIAGAEGDAERLQRAALDQLIEDRLKLQEARRRGIEPADEMIAAGLESFAEARGTTAEALQGRLQQAGVSALAIRDLIAAEVAWIELVRSRFLSEARPSDVELESELELMTEGSDIGELAPQAREQARQQIVGERVGRLAEGLLQDLRGDALIEIR